MSSIEKNSTYKMWSFRAIDEPELCEKYIEGHVKVLTDYGITSISSNNKLWLSNPYMYCLAVKNLETEELVGGIRIQIADGVSPLPVEKGIGHMDERIYNVVKKYAFDGGVGELNGLWVSNKLKGVGMGPYLVRAAIASATQLNFKTLIGICGENTMQMFKNVGFLVNESLGKMGGFPYPTNDLTAHVVGILDAITLQTAAEHDKKIMIFLRQNLLSERIEKNNNFTSNIEYNLIFKNVTINKYGTSVE
jgi:hypothetical protein